MGSTRIGGVACALLCCACNARSGGAMQAPGADGDTSNGADTVIGDTTPPQAVASVDDGTWSMFTDRSPLIDWPAASDAESGVARYELAVGTAPGGGFVIGWSDQGLATSATLTGLSLTHGVTYYAMVRVVDAAGNVSAVTSSDGWSVDTRIAPATTVVSPASNAVLTATTQLFAGWCEYGATLAVTYINATTDFASASTGDNPAVVNCDACTLAEQPDCGTTVDSRGKFELPIAFAGGQGARTIEIMATDRAGNVEAEVSHTVIFGVPKVVHTIGTIQVNTTDQARALNGGTVGWPMQQVFVAANGQALVIYAYLPDGTSGITRFAWRQSNDVSYDNWSAENVIEAYATGSSNTFGWGVSGWQDASDNVYVVGFRRHADFRTITWRLDRIAGGWLAAGPAILESGTDISTCEVHKPTIAKVPATGKVWIFRHKSCAGPYEAFYSTNNGGSFAGPVNIATSPAGYDPWPGFIVAWGSKVGVLYKTSELVWRERDDTALPSDWGPEVILWSGAEVNFTDSWSHGALVHVVGHPDATLVALARLSDGSGRLKRYIDGSGWQSGDITYGTGLDTFMRTRSTVRGTTPPTLLVWPGSGGPLLYDPATDALSPTGFDAAATIMAPRTATVGAWRRWFGASSDGDSSPSATLRFHEQGE